MCAELLPELITADPWGYPIIAPGPVPGDLLPLARRAVAACPTLALLLTDGRPTSARPTHIGCASETGSRTNARATSRRRTGAAGHARAAVHAESGLDLGQLDPEAS